MRNGAARCEFGMSRRLRPMPEFTWDVQLPGEDLLRRVTTDYVLSEGEELTVDGRTWTIDRVETDPSLEDATGVVTVIPPREPL
jgi:hypothetical protein